LPILLDQSCLKSLGNGFSTRSGVEFRQYRRDVMVNRSCGDEKTLGNVPLNEGGHCEKPRRKKDGRKGLLVNLDIAAP
jgi:hypothetical protein